MTLDLSIHKFNCTENYRMVSYSTRLISACSVIKTSIIIDCDLISPIESHPCRIVSSAPRQTRNVFSVHFVMTANRTSRGEWLYIARQIDTSLAGIYEDWCLKAFLSDKSSNMFACFTIVINGAMLVQFTTCLIRDEAKIAWVVVLLEYALSEVSASK